MVCRPYSMSICILTLGHQAIIVFKVRGLYTRGVNSYGLEMVWSDAFTQVVWIFSQLWFAFIWVWPWCEFLHNCEFLWIECLHFCTWFCRLHTCGVKFFTTVNSAHLKVCIFVLGSDEFTRVMWICSQLWTVLILKVLVLVNWGWNY